MSYGPDPVRPGPAFGSEVYQGKRHRVKDIYFKLILENWLNLLVLLCYPGFIVSEEAAVFTRYRKTSMIIPVELHEKLTKGCKPMEHETGEIVRVKSLPDHGAHKTKRRSRLGRFYVERTGDCDSRDVLKKASGC